MARLSHVLLLTGCVFLLGDNLFAAAGGTCPASVPSGTTSCFYADYTNGSDTNAGTSEAAPLQHFPGMAGCAKNCSSLTPAAGEGFILRGGITWPAAALPWAWSWSGSSTTSTPGCTGSGCIYIGVDPTWYTGSAWARPILNSGGSSGNANKSIFEFVEPGNYIVLDNIELTGFYWSGSPVYGTANLNLPGGDTGIGMHDTVEHIYIHGWSHGTTGNGTTEAPCGITGDTANVNNGIGTIIEYSVVDGSDTDKQSCDGAIFGGTSYIAYNEMKYVSSCMVIDGPVSVHDNICENVVSSFSSTAHENGLEINYDSQNHTVYNNIIRHVGSGALSFWDTPGPGYTGYVFNNLIYDTDVNNVIDLGSQSEYYNGEAGTTIFWNNTVECGQDSGPDAVCVANIGAGVAAVTLQNNHFITNAGSYWSSAGPKPTLTTNILQTLSQANGQRYISSETYAFSPTAAYPTDATPGQGTSASSLCSAAGVSSTVCANDTTYGVAYNTTNHTVSSPGRTTVPWKSPPDVGAYSFGTAPAAPTDVNGSPVQK